MIITRKIPSAGYKYLPLGVCVTRVVWGKREGRHAKKGAAMVKTHSPQNKKGRKNIPAPVSGKGSAAPPVTRVPLRVCR